MDLSGGGPLRAGICDMGGSPSLSGA